LNSAVVWREPVLSTSRNKNRPCVILRCFSVSFRPGWQGILNALKRIHILVGPSPRPPRNRFIVVGQKLMSFSSVPHRWQHLSLKCTTTNARPSFHNLLSRTLHLLEFSFMRKIPVSLRCNSSSELLASYHTHLIIYDDQSKETWL